ncbi:hypothetical protein PCASD_02682 [Puccinia coronata f. sp. avenae]|uniref:Uncharacterized protein n=1 Tax=Puccinia coronata f. sp. avenae TaxID=200324 RepID=A0A2N5VH13_9BASI|nr:hypothetical protein PCASD_02682 [Puccinia coronata f. sp. avenae]
MPAKKSLRLWPAGTTPRQQMNISNWDLKPTHYQKICFNCHQLAPSERAVLSNNTLSTPLVSSNKTASLTQTLPPATHLQAATPSAQPLSNDYAAQESNSLMLMGLDEIDQLEMEPAYPPDQGIAPSEVFSWAPSTAIESNRSTPVPHPVERQHFAVLRREVPPLSMAGSTTPTPTHRLDPTNNPKEGKCR